MKQYDLSELITMSQGNTEFVNQMVSVFLTTTEESLNEMVSCLNDKKFLEVSGLAHKIKPSIQLMGITDLTDVVAQIEVRGKDGGGGLGLLMSNFEETLRSVFKDMRDEFQ